mmetsp:Transcript_482/g.1897  ORF Transcript_482/g.1897 Transcript_482/m.1897 type:complete len:296 (+) Transcript_482:367-1254(+)
MLANPTGTLASLLPWSVSSSSLYILPMDSGSFMILLLCAQRRSRVMISTISSGNVSNSQPSIASSFSGQLEMDTGKELSLVEAALKISSFLRSPIDSGRDLIDVNAILISVSAEHWTIESGSNSRCLLPRTDKCLSSLRLPMDAGKDTMEDAPKISSSSLAHRVIESGKAVSAKLLSSRSHKTNFLSSVNWPMLDGRDARLLPETLSSRSAVRFTMSEGKSAKPIFVKRNLSTRAKAVPRLSHSIRSHSCGSDWVHNAASSGHLHRMFRTKSTSLVTLYVDALLEKQPIIAGGSE